MTNEKSYMMSKSKEDQVNVIKFIEFLEFSLASRQFFYTNNTCKITSRSGQRVRPWPFSKKMTVSQQ
jgi:hypothetical protein